MPPSTALKALAEYSALFTIIAKNYNAYTFQAVSLVSAKLSRLYCPTRLTVNFACWVAIIEIQGEAEDMKYETLRADLLETAWGVYRIPYRSHKDIVYYINVFGVFVTRSPDITASFHRIEERK